MNQHNHSEHEQEHEHIPGTGPPEELDMCPVIHIPVNKKEAEEKGHMREYNGKKYHFCCATCTAKFDENPAQYTEEQNNG